LDPFGLFQSFSELGASWLRDMGGFLGRVSDLNQALWDQNDKALALFLDVNGNGVKSRAANENTLTEWAGKNGAIGAMYHRTASRWFKRLIQDSPGLTDAQRKRISFWADQVIGAAAPQNYFWSNPYAVKVFLDSQGKSLENSWFTWTEENLRGQPFAPLADKGAFSVGENLATTPGDVVFRNSLMEVIQYRPVTEKTYAHPIVLIQPMINKYYIFDLSEANSFVRFLIRRGFTVFITSWKNPSSDMRNVSFEDYLTQGALEAIEIACAICRTDNVHAAGYCIGGTLLAALMAWLNHPGKGCAPVPVSDWTLFSALVDYSEPGPLTAFTKSTTADFVETAMADTGYLDKRFLHTAFRMLKAESLIWRPHVATYLLGQPPPASDVLFWNSDGTRLSEALCSFLLKALYQDNLLIQKNGLSLASRPIDLANITQPLYIVGAKQDHICPWQSTFVTCGLVSAPVRYVLSREGHITGIVNPPAAGSKKKYQANAVDGNENPEKWLLEQAIKRGSWWEDWCEWLFVRSGPKVLPPVAGGGVYRPLETAPGRYVFES
jgi:polyhydroxyalkanoate synthase